MKNVVLLGFMGTGKSIVGRGLAVELQYRFVDTDRLIEERVGKRIPEIFSQDGEAYFRTLEAEVVAEIADWEAYVISTGGGVPLNPKNVKALDRTGIFVTLSTRPEVILKRVKRRAGERPLLKGPDPLSAIRSLLSERKKYYNRSAITVDTSDIPIEESVKRIMAQLPDSIGYRL